MNGHDSLQTHPSDWAVNISATSNLVVVERFPDTAALRIAVAGEVNDHLHNPDSYQATVQELFDADMAFTPSYDTVRRCIEQRAVERRCNLLLEAAAAVTVQRTATGEAPLVAA